MAGIYIHIPFCKKACNYCNFHFSTSLALKPELLAALHKEIELVSGHLPAGAAIKATPAYLGGEPVETIYFGGGTPSLLSEVELNSILASLRRNFSIEPNAEITLEANPDDITPVKVREWKEAGINRLSIGVQSFFEEDLRWMNRAHTAQQALASIQAAQQSGIENITIDLIYGTPTLTDDHWEQNIGLAIQSGVPHLSCYALTVEPSTALQKLISQKKLPDVDPEKQANQFLLLTSWLRAAGFEHYEISNFAKPGMRSRHNSSYWQGKMYLGIGPSAHSFNGSSRQWNIANNALYIQSLKNNTLPSETEQLTEPQQINEYIMTSLRTVEGLDLEYLDRKFGNTAVLHIQKGAAKYVDKGSIQFSEKTLRLTAEGKLYADGIAADLFM